jgi:acetyl esterase/lipase
MSADRKRSKKFYSFLILSIIFFILFGTSLVFYSQGIKQSEKYEEYFTIDLITIDTFDGYKYDMYQIIPDTIKNYNNESAPFILVLHGLGSNKESQMETAMTFATYGFVCVVPDMRGSGSHTGPFSFGVDDITDMKNLITWVEDNTELKMVNKSNVGTFGHSMGAMMSMLTAVQDNRVKSCVAGSGPTNISQVLIDEEFRLNLIGTPIDITDQSEIDARSVITYANSTNPTNLFIAHGTADKSVPYVHSVMLNNTINANGTRSNYKFITYDNADHGLSNSTLSGYSDFVRQSVQWFYKYLMFDSIAFDDVKMNSRSSIRSEMRKNYENMYITITVSVVPLLFMIQLILGYIYEKLESKKNPSKNVDKMEDGKSIPKYIKGCAVPINDKQSENSNNGNGLVDVRQPPSKKEIFIQLGYLGLYLLSFILMGIATKDIIYPRVLKIILFPMFPLIPITAWKLSNEKNSLFFKELGLNLKNTIVSVLAAFITFGYYLGFYNLLASRTYSFIEVIQWVMQAGTTLTLTNLFWMLMPGFLVFILIVSLYFQELYKVIVSSIKSNKIHKILTNWFVKAILLGIMVGLIHSTGIRLYNLLIPDFDLGVFNFPYSFYEIVFTLGIGIVIFITIGVSLLTKTTKNVIGSALILSLVLTLLYVTAIPRVF